MQVTNGSMTSLLKPNQVKAGFALPLEITWTRGVGFGGLAFQASQVRRPPSTAGRDKPESG